ncbi:MAG: GNAT family N-acetyltransferase, partial [Spirochaetes bacterium]|nr:GNAT family N-acetyltransferase [Spirochaetota bacterium]
MSEKLRWSKMKKNEEAATEVFLRKSEGYYVGACSRFIGRAASDKTWILSGRDSSIRAIILHSKRGILPVFCGQTEIPPPPFICGFFAAKNINSILGLKAEVLRLEGFMEGAGRKAYDKIDYDLMVLDQSPGEKSLSPSPAGLVLRKPLPADFDSLAGLQAAYEQEEVLPAGAVFSPAASRANLERLLEKAEILVAELDGRLVG